MQIQQTLSECIDRCSYSADVQFCLQACTNAAGLGPAPEQHLSLTPIVSIAAIFLAIFLSGLFSGLTLGLLTLDLVGLRILLEAGDADERRYAQKIIPVRKKGNLLLCTLLLGNTVINSALSILVADLTTGIVGLLVSTFVILIFGEILPQSVCTRHGLWIGAHSIWLVKFFIVVLAPIAYPLSLALDALLGADIGTVYSQDKLKRLIDIHVTDPAAQRESGLTRADHRLIMGALDYKRKSVRDVMTGVEQAFMLDINTRLTFQAMLLIYKSGFTRIPVHEGGRHNIVGILYAKDLILVDPDDEVELGAVLSFRGRNVGHIYEDVALDTVFRQFIGGSNHMLIAHARPAAARTVAGGYPAAVSPSDEDLETGTAPVTGLITLEDVMEELIQTEIVDETDIYEDVNRQLPRRGAARVDVALYLEMFEHKMHHVDMLSASELSAVAAFLSLKVSEFAALQRSEVALKRLIGHSELLERDLDSPAGNGSGNPGSPDVGHASSFRSPLPARTMSSEWGGKAAWDAVLPEANHKLLYSRGVPSDTFTLILQGRVLIRTGAEGFELELGPWSVLGNRALSDPHYVPDFDALAAPPFRLVRITRPDYAAALEECKHEPTASMRNAALKGQLPGGNLSARSLRDFNSDPQWAPSSDSVASIAFEIERGMLGGSRDAAAAMHQAGTAGVSAPGWATTRKSKPSSSRRGAVNSAADVVGAIRSSATTSQQAYTSKHNSASHCAFPSPRPPQTPAAAVQLDSCIGLRSFAASVPPPLKPRPVVNQAGNNGHVRRGSGSSLDGAGSEQPGTAGSDVMGQPAFASDDAALDVPDDDRQPLLQT